MRVYLQHCELNSGCKNLEEKMAQVQFGMNIMQMKLSVGNKCISLKYHPL